MLRTNRLSWRLQHGGYSNAGVSGQTFSNLAHLEVEPCWVRLIYFNDLPVPWTIDGAAVAPSSSIHDGFSPTNDAGVPDDALWRQITFSGVGLDGEPISQTVGNAATLKIVGNPGSPGRPILAFSDWLPLAGLSRADGGAGAFLLIRTYSSGVLRYSGSLGLPDPSIGRVHAGFWSPGNGTRAPWTFRANPFNGAFASYGLQYIAASAGATVVGIGDSIMQCMASAGHLSTFGVRACVMLSKPQYPVSYFNEGYIGRNSEDYCSNGIWVIEHLRPQVALIQTWSQNDPNTQAGADLGLCPRPGRGRRSFPQPLYANSRHRRSGVCSATGA